jgi:hypothetical protein
MTDELDRLLAHEDDVVPSSGFTEAVMAAVRAAEAGPPPIPFPWTRAWVSFAAVAVAVVVSTVDLVRLANRPTADGSSLAMGAAVRATIQSATTPEAVWTIGALLLATAVTVGAIRTSEWLHRR